MCVGKSEREREGVKETQCRVKKVHYNSREIIFDEFYEDI